jgi:hypothetical protein
VNRGVFWGSTPFEQANGVEEKIARFGRTKWWQKKWPLSRPKAPLGVGAHKKSRMAQTSG